MPCLVALMSGCTQDEDKQADPLTDSSAIIEPDLLPAEVSAKVNRLGWEIVKILADENMDNIALSPVSIRGAFVPLQQGTAGNTLAEVDEVMGEAVVFQKFCDQYNHSDNGTKLVNALMVDKSIPLLDGFKHELPKGQLHQADFLKNKEKERQNINKWIEKNTDGHLKNMLSSSDLTGLVRMVSLNASVFDGKWEYPFVKEDNTKENFHSSHGDVIVTMMNRELHGLLATGPQSSFVVSLPYRKEGDMAQPSDLDFVIVMPREEQALKNFIETTTWEDLSISLPTEEQGSVKYTLTMPKFEITSPMMNISKHIQRMGVRELFSMDADFSKMTPYKGLYAERVFHKCYINVSEEGTKAAAATVIGVEAVGIVMDDKVFVKVDRPFLWFIYDKKQKLVLFCGTLNSFKH